jgi:hypothetical protein
LVSGFISVRPRVQGFRQDPPLPVLVERGELGLEQENLVERIRVRIREALLVTTEVSLVDHASLPRSSYKSHLVDWSDAVPSTR